MLQRFQEGLAVGDAGQAVAIGQLANLFLGAFAFADVAHQAEDFTGCGADQPRFEVVTDGVARQLVIDRMHGAGMQHGR